MKPPSQATVSIEEVMGELSSLMKSLPLYTNDFLEMILQILRKYLQSCREAYKGKIFNLGFFYFELLKLFLGCLVNTDP